MIYVCISSHNNGPTIGLLLWKIRNVFNEFPRQYQLLVLDDASADDTAAILKPYVKSLPLTIITRRRRVGRAESFEILMRDALQRSDRHKRDCVITIPADFSVSPAALPELVKKFESGADVIIGEMESGDDSFTDRLLRRCAPWLLSPGIKIPGVKDLTSGCAAFRMVTIKNFIGENDERVLRNEGASTFPEFLARASSGARQIATEPLTRGPGTLATNEYGFIISALNLLGGGQRVKIPSPDQPANARS